MFAILTKLFGNTKSAKPRKPQGYRPCMEGLEDRMLMAGDVTARVDSAGSLILDEKSGQVGRDNAVQINRLANGNVLVEGLATADGTKSLINGAPFQELKGVKSGLFVRFLEGRDDVIIGNNGRPISFTSAYIDVGEGEAVPQPDSVKIQNMTVGPTTASTMFIGTGAGDDFVKVINSKIVGEFNISMFRGNDILDLENVQANSVGAFMDPFRPTGHADDFGIDAVLMQNVTTKFSLSVQMDPVLLADGSEATTGSSDFVSLSHVRAGTFVSVSTAGGQDTVKLYDVVAVDKLFTRLGAGDDTLSLIGCGNNEIEVDGGSGHDRLSNQNLTFKHMRILGFEEIQTPKLNPNVNNGLTFTAV